jgi:hypothetical protein
MTDFLSVVGKQVARRWLAFLALPGVLFLSAAAVAHTLGQRRSLDLRMVVHTASDLAARFEGRPLPAVLLGIGVAVAAAAVGVLAQGAGTAVQLAWLVTSLPWPGGRLIGWRRQARERRWLEAHRRYQEARKANADQTALAELAQARNRIGIVKPCHPTWTGDRLAAAGSRIYNQYGLDFQFAWPRLWLLLPDPVRTEIRDARDSFTAAATLQAWGLLYLALGIIWWPAAAAGAFTVALGWRRGRASAAGLADLVESAVDLHNRDLVTALGFSPPSDGPLTRRTGEPGKVTGAEINELIRKGS